MRQDGIGGPVSLRGKHGTFAQGASLRLLALCALGVAILMLMPSTARAQSSRIAFVTDRTTEGDLDVWKMREDGTYPAEVTDETGDGHNPSIISTGLKIVYDFDDDLYVVGINGGTPQNLTGSGTDPCNEDSSDLCTDPDAGPLVLGGQGDYRVVFTRTTGTGNGLRSDIWMGTVDVSEGKLVGAVQVAAGWVNGSQRHPSWCGSTHVVWDRAQPLTLGAREICIVDVDADGPVGSPACYSGDDSDPVDYHVDEEPACAPDGSKI